jgi:multidrug transporter EmrE-like cation transporter
MCSIFKEINRISSISTAQFQTTPLKYGLTMALIDVSMLSIVKQVSLDSKIIKWMVIPTVIYALQPWIFLQSLQFESLIIMNLMWDVISDVLVTLVGLIFFKETIGAYKLVGVLLSFISITLMSLEDGPWKFSLY